MADLNLLLVGCGGIAVLAAALDNSLPPALRPWWRGRSRIRFAPRTQRVGDLPAQEQTDAEVAPVPLHLVQTEDRRRVRLPFVGRDRRQAAQAPLADAPARRRAGRD